MKRTRASSPCHSRSRRLAGMRRRLAAASLTGALLLVAGCGDDADAPPTGPVSTLLDISGIAWMRDDLFLAVHDGKTDADEKDLPRASLILLPADVTTPPEFARDARSGLYFRNLEIDWGTAGVSHDIESIARIPGTQQVLLVESGDDCSPYQRIFVAALGGDYRLRIEETVRWPASGRSDCSGVFNVEATAVFRSGGQLFFVYAERAEGQAETELRWAPITLAPLRFGAFGTARIASPIPPGPGVRPIVALDVDAGGQVHAASAFDSGEDNGPFSSQAATIGQFRAQAAGGVEFVPTVPVTLLGRQDGLKIEGVTVRDAGSGVNEIYVGSDDENYGAVMRRIQPMR